MWLLNIFLAYFLMCFLILLWVVVMAISNLIKRHQEAVTLTRPGAQTVSGGYAQEGTPGVFIIQAVAQQLQSKDLRNLPPGQNATDWRNFWSLVELKIKDKITIAGQTFTLQSVSDWPQGGFYSAQGSKVSDTL